MSSSKGKHKAGTKGEPPPTTEEPRNLPPTEEDPAPSSKKRGFCSWHLLALLPIIIAFIVYHIPTFYDEYMARMGYVKLDTCHDTCTCVEWAFSIHISYYIVYYMYISTFVEQVYECTL